MSKASSQSDMGAAVCLSGCVAVVAVISCGSCPVVPPSLDAAVSMRVGG